MDSSETPPLGNDSNRPHALTHDSPLTTHEQEQRQLTKIDKLRKLIRDRQTEASSQEHINIFT